MKLLHVILFTFSLLLMIGLISFLINIAPCLKTVVGMADCTVGGATFFCHELLGRTRAGCKVALGSALSVKMGLYIRRRLLTRRTLRINKKGKDAYDKKYDEEKTNWKNKDKPTDAEKADAEKAAKADSDAAIKQAEKEETKTTVEWLKSRPWASKSVNDSAAGEGKTGEELGNEISKGAEATEGGEAVAEGSESAATTGAAVTTEADAGVALAGETGGLSLVAALAEIGITIAATALAKWVSGFWKYCPCDYPLLGTTFLPICYKGTCAEEFGPGFTESKGSSGGMCHKCNKGWKYMGFDCGRGLKTENPHWRVRKTHTALLTKPNCPTGDDNKKATVKEVIQYIGTIFGILLLLFLFGYGMKSALTPKIVKVKNSI